MPILNYTTSIDAHKTVSEIQKLLSSRGAQRIMLDYGTGGKPIALAFQLKVNGDQLLHYRLPCRHLQVLSRLKRDADVPRRFETENHALDVAWRIIKNWTEVQLALVDSNQSEMSEVFFQYALTGNGKTFYEEMTNNNFLLEDKQTKN